MDDYLEKTMCRVLNCNCDGGCVLKSIVIENPKRVVVEPYDHRFDEEVVERTLYRRRKAILKALGTSSVAVTAYNEWRMYGAYTITKDKLYIN